MSGRGSGETPSTVGATLRTRSVIPLALLGLVLVYELLWKGSVITPGSLAARIANVTLFLVVGPIMAWWGQSVARLLLQRLAHSEAASEEKNRFLEQRNLQLQTVLQASRTMTSVLDFAQVATLAVGQVAAYTRFSRAALILGPDEQGQFSLGAAHDLPEEFLQAFLPALTGPLKASSPLEWCQLTRQPVVVENLAKDFRTAGMRAVFALARAEGLIAVPLVLREQFRGSLIVFLEKSGPIATAEISLISALASQATLALENARLYTLTVQNRTRLDQALEFLQSVATALARSRAGISPLLHQVAHATARLFAPASVRLIIRRPGRAAPQTVTETVGMESPGGEPQVSLPVRLDGTEFGCFELYLAGEGRTLDAEETQILQAFVCLTASGLGHAAAIGEMHQAVDVVERAYMGTLEALTKALEMRDHETEGHSRRVVQYTLSLAQKLAVPEEQLIPLIRGALLHDIGKIGIPDAILKKQGPLTPAEWAIMKQHPRIGYDMLRQIEFLCLATPIILHHHERYDGSGYPQGLAGEEIPLGARIFAVADAYDAMTSDRPYRKGRSHEAALAELVAEAGRQFDPQVVEALQELPEEELARIRGLDLQLVR